MTEDEQNKDSTSSVHDSFRDQITSSKIVDPRRRSLIDNKQPANYSLDSDQDVCKKICSVSYENKESHVLF